MRQDLEDCTVCMEIHVWYNLQKMEDGQYEKQVKGIRTVFQVELYASICKIKGMNSTESLKSKLILFT